MEKPFSWSWPEIKSLATTTYQEWQADDASHMGASLAFYTMLSLAPLLLIMIAIAGWALGEKAASGQLMTQIQGMVGTDGAKAISEMLKGASNPKKGAIAGLLGLATLLWGAASVLGELRLALNRIWKVPKENEEGIASRLKQQSYLFGLVLGCGFLLLVSLVVSAGLAAAGKFMASSLPLPAGVFQVINLVVSLGVLTGVFAVMFKVLPKVRVSWRDVLLGAVVTSLLFTLGKLLIGMYLGQASFGSTFGAAGSLVIVLVWVYYSSQILFFGAEFTQVYARLHGSNPLQGFEHAIPSVSNAETASWVPNRPLPPILSLEPASRVDHGLAGSVGGLIGALVALGKSVSKGMKA